MRLPFEKALVCLSLLLEGSSIRGAERVTGVHRDTLCRLLVTVGEGCAPLHRRLTAGFAPGQVELGEIHGILGMTEATKQRLGVENPRLGSVAAWVEMEPASKLVAAWGLGRPDSEARRARNELANGGPHAARHSQVLRAQLRRLGPRTQAFSRKWENLEAALALHVTHYNLCRIHSALRHTPAMAADLTPRLWSLEDLVRAAMAARTPPAADPAG
jgi:hypothetical protein